MTSVAGDGAISVTTDVTDSHLRLGVELKQYQSNDCKFDHFTLEYLGGDNGTTSIDNVQTSNGQQPATKGTIYDLNGLPHHHPLKGINILNGQKVVVK